MILVALVAAALGSPPTPDANASFDRIVDAYLNEELQSNPELATELGLHEHDGELGSFSAAAQARKRRAVVTALDQLAALDPSQLDRDHAIDLAFLRGKLHGALLDLDEIRAWERNPNLYNAVGSSAVDALLRRDFAPLCDRVRSAVSRMRAIPRVLDEGKQNLRAPARILTETALAETDGAIDFFTQAVPTAAADCKDPALHRELDAARGRVLHALTEWKRHLEKTVLPRATGSFALGADLFARKLGAEELVDEPLPALMARGRAELARLRADFERTAKKIDPARTPREVIEAVNRDHPDAADLLPSFRRTVSAIRSFMLEHRIVPLPPGENLRVTETPTYERTLSFASMETPGPFETRGLEGYFYVTPVDPAWQPAEREEHLRAFDRFAVENTIMHEAYPGHYIQGLYRRQSPSKVRRVWSSYAFTEGWALYAEQMMLEEGQNRDPRAWLVMLQWALVRAGRYLAGTAMHTQGMSVAEAARLLEEDAYLARANAMREARRFASDPFVLNYQLGKLEILALRDELRKAERSRFRLEEFHRRLLETGGLPLPLVRKLLLPVKSR